MLNLHSLYRTGGSTEICDKSSQLTTNWIPSRQLASQLATLASPCCTSLLFFFFLSTTRSSWSNIVFPSPCCPKGFYLGLSSINHITEAVARVTSGHSKTFKPLKKLLGHSSIVWHSVIAWHHYIFGGQQHSTFKNWIKNWKKTGTFTPYTLFILLVGNKDN